MHWFLVLYLYAASTTAPNGYVWKTEVKSSHVSEAGCRAAAHEARKTLTIKDGEGAGYACIPEMEYRERMQRSK